MEKIEIVFIFLLMVILVFVTIENILHTISGISLF